jgi:hypothetical protein
VYYLDDNNIVNDMIYSPNTKSFSPGVLANRQYRSIDNGSLAALYDQCVLCGNTSIFAFQDEHGFIQIGNYSLSDGWSLTQLGAENVPLPGTALAMRPKYVINSTDTIEVHYQRLGNLEMAQVSYISEG